MKNEPQLIIGLGNPGEKYEKTYHNAGFLLIDFLVENVSGPLSRSTFESNSSRTKQFSYFKSKNFILAKPLTFMNESGRAVKSALDYFGMEPAHLLVAHDDSDIELGKYKLSFGRSSAGHRGVESVIASLKTKNFSRIRIGVRKRPKHAGLLSRTKAGDLVLKKITKKDTEILEKVFAKLNNEINPQNG